MKAINIFFILSLFLSGTYLIAQPNFELWNKHTEPLYYSVSNSISEAQHKPLQELRAGKWTTARTMDTSKPTVIAVALGKMPQPGQLIDVYTIKPGKTLFIRVGLPAEKEKFKETIKKLFGKTSLEGNNYIFGPQTGPLIGFKGEGLFSFDLKGVSERKYSLKNNFDVGDITPAKIVYLPK